MVIAGPAHFKVTTIVSGISVVLTFLGYIGDLPVGGVNPIPSGATVSPSGTQSPIGNQVSVYANGTPYSMTTAFAQVVFGTLSPQKVLPAAGTWLIFARAVIDFLNDGAARTTTSLKLVRSNNSPGDVANSLTNVVSIANPVGAVYGGMSITTPPVIYVTANTTDNIELSAMIDAFSGTAPTITEASIVAIQIT